ncbi:MAG: class I SAM-dependent methyltransferase [Planctomycetaceae bacterium]|jgi:SAM-dependent methyltransferase|nr:class I SAM-dependent methyltransferase [Planctomycetaceae bacterium]
MSIYDYPVLYDVLFSDSWKREIEFLKTALQYYCNISGRGRIFEPACGTGRLLWRLARLGHNVAGLDLNPKAVSFCNKRLKRHGLKESAILGDMTDFSLNSLQQKKPFDLAFNFVSSFLHLTSETAALSHFRAVAEILKPNGIYLLGLHLLPRGDAVCSQEQWSVRHGSLALQSQLRRLSLNRQRRIETVEFRIKATTPKRRYEIIDTFPLRTYTLQQFRILLKKANCFDILETFDFNFQSPVPLNSQTEDVVFVLKKIESDRVDS